METWKHGDMKTWKHGDIDTWTHGNMDRHGDRRHGDMKIWTWRDGHEDMKGRDTDMDMRRIATLMLTKNMLREKSSKVM